MNRYRKEVRMYTQYNKKIPVKAVQIINEIEKAGYEAYIVGGCVRDLLMNREPHDWDITTSAKPEDIKKIFKRTYDTGIEHGTVTVILDEQHFEVTTYRIEDDYKDFRRPDKVRFVEDITLDLSRRDFTMNAIAYHPKRGFIDPYNGQQDINDRCIRSVRSARERFTEDALRILRAVRFSAQIGFNIEKDTVEGIRECRHLLLHISKERVRDEFLKICLSDSPEHIDIIYELGLMGYIIPEFIPAYETSQNHPYHIYNVAKHSIVAMQNIDRTVALRLTMLLHDIGKISTRKVDKNGIDHFYGHANKSVEMATSILKNLRLDNNTIRDIKLLIKYHDYHIECNVDKVVIKKILCIVGDKLFDDLVKVQIADAKAQNPIKLEKSLDIINNIVEIKADIINKNEPYNKSMLKITGADLILSGIERGEIIGQLLEDALDLVIKTPEMNNRELLIRFCTKKLKDRG